MLRYLHHIDRRYLFLNVLKRAFLYDIRKKWKSLTLFLLFVLITVFVTISFSVLSATQAAAANLQEAVSHRNGQ